MKKSDRMFKELMEIESKKGTVWDDRKNDLGYKAHRKGLTKVTKKVDNDSPLIASASFFPQMKYVMRQKTVENRIRSNIVILKRLNEIQRTRGKIDNLNDKSSYHETVRKIKEREKELDLIDRCNKRYAKFIADVPPKVELTEHLLKHYYEIDRKAIFHNAKYKIVFDFLKHPKMKRFDSPKGTRILISVCRKDGKLFGRIEILLFNDKVDPNILNYFIELCKTSYKDCYIHKIMKDLFIETGDVENSFKIFPNNANNPPLSHNRDGLVTLLLNDDGSVSPRFAITMQSLRVFDDNHLVIGKVVEGVNLITDLDAHGTQFGIPERMFFITVTAVRQ